MKRLIRDQKGSFILESSLVFPSIFVAILILLFFCLYLYQNAALGQVAAVAAERSAYSWDNSYRKPLTGAYETRITSYNVCYTKLLRYRRDELMRGGFESMNGLERSGAAQGVA